MSKQQSDALDVMCDLSGCGNIVGYVTRGHCCELEYRTDRTEDWCSVRLVRVTPDDDADVYKICATYAKQVKPSTYYLCATSKKSARARFNSIYAPMLSIVSCQAVGVKSMRKSCSIQRD